MITHYQNIQLSSIYTTSLTLPQVGHASWPCLTCFVDTEIVVFQEPYWKYLQVASWKECRRDLNHPRKLFTNKVTINFDMLCAFMKNKIPAIWSVDWLSQNRCIAFLWNMPKEARRDFNYTSLLVTVALE